VLLNVFFELLEATFKIVLGGKSVSDGGFGAVGGAVALIAGVMAIAKISDALLEKEKPVKSSPPPKPWNSLTKFYFFCVLGLLLGIALYFGDKHV
jgi:hypothetical protein